MRVFIVISSQESLPLREERYRGEIVYNFFDNLLPDSEQIRNRIQSRFHVPTKQPFDLLSRIGMDCVGAIQLWPHGADIPSVQKVNAEPLSEDEIEYLLLGYKDAPLGMQAEVDDFRISLAGVQEKTALLWWNNRWCRPRGSTPTSHIFKLPIGYTEPPFSLEYHHAPSFYFHCARSEFSGVAS